MITLATAPPACSPPWRLPAARSTDAATVAIGTWSSSPFWSRWPEVTRSWMHLICDNYGTHKHPAVKRWLAAHPRFHLHFTPTSASWLNLVERWFALITSQAIRRGSFDSTRRLEQTIM